MPTPTRPRTDAFRDLERALTRRRLMGLDPRLRAELALLALRVAAFLFWQVRVPLDGLVTEGGIIAAVLHRPPVLLREEALEGFDAGGALAAKAELRALAASGSAVLFSSHVTGTIGRLCDRAILLHGGRVARVVERSTWDRLPSGPSPLEREFLAVAGPSTR